jgi:hypothetical protein
MLSRHNWPSEQHKVMVEQNSQDTRPDPQIGIRKDLNLQKQFDNRIVMKIEVGFSDEPLHTGK